MANDEKIQAAIQEVGRGYVGAVAPSAFLAARNLLADVNHKDLCRAIALFLDRSWPVENLSRQQIDVAHKHEFSEPDPILMQKFAASIGVSLERVLGVSRPTKVIDHAPAAEPVPVAANQTEQEQD